MAKRSWIDRLLHVSALETLASGLVGLAAVGALAIGTGTLVQSCARSGAMARPDAAEPAPTGAESRAMDYADDEPVTDTRTGETVPFGEVKDRVRPWTGPR